MGRRFRKIADRAASDHHAADIPWRHLLFDQRAAAVLADGDAVQSAGLFDLGFPLELLRHRRRQCRRERSDDARLPRDLPGDRLVVLQNRVPVEELTGGLTKRDILILGAMTDVPAASREAM